MKLYTTFQILLSPFFILLILFLTSASALHHHPLSPIQKCGQFPKPTPQTSPRPLPDALLYFLSDTENIENFFESHFEQYPLHIDDSTRPDRLQWMSVYRRILPREDIDKLLQHNASLTASSSLQLGVDVDLQRLQSLNSHTWYRPRLATLFSGSNPPNKAIDLDRIHSAFRDGFELIVHGLEYRSRTTSTLIDSLQAFFAVNVTSNLHMLPPKTRSLTTQPAIEVSASDRFLVILDGEVDANVHPEAFPLPNKIHEEDENVLNVARVASQESKGKKVFKLDEGDVLYVPRGAGLDVRTYEGIAMMAEFSIATHEIDLTRGVLTAVEVSRATMEDCPLDEYVEGTDDEVVWVDIVNLAIRIASEFMPQMRRHLPIATAAADAVESATGENTIDMVKECLGRFGKAAVEALFGPMLEVLVTEEKAGAIAGDKIVSWAKRLVTEKGNDKDEKQKLRKRTNDMFKVCIDWVTQLETVPYDAVTQLTLGVYENWKQSQEERERKREIGLERHGEKNIVWNITNSESESVDDVCDVEREAVGACSL